LQILNKIEQSINFQLCQNIGTAHQIEGDKEQNTTMILIRQ